MKRRFGEKTQLLIGILFMAMILIAADTIIFLVIMFERGREPYMSPSLITENLSVINEKYQLEEKIQEQLKENGIFAMIISNKGEILWSEQLPNKLYKEYSIQDVAGFVRYYLEDYPVHTYIVDDGLLVIGDMGEKIWKYNLEYKTDDFQRMIQSLPVLLLINAVLLISVPLIIQRRELKRREAERTEWIAGVSHDIRTPLTIMIGSAEYLKQNCISADERKKADIIEMQGLKIRSLVDNLNFSSKLDYGMAPFKKSEVKLSSLLRAILADIMNRCEDGRFEFNLDIEQELKELTVKGSRDLIERAVVNLANNSIRHNPDGCMISVSLRRAPRKRRRYILEFQDNGKGASQEQIDSLNHKYYERMQTPGIHGLGLKIVRQVAAYHRWKINFYNAMPHGFACIICLR